mmetsp:Transcript_156286/g.501443  ORF Transcript_156286/g.501443 Transcript_156286/m.501443 type:complete len:217 (+) Transcript_156286:751-1401(+)
MDHIEVVVVMNRGLGGACNSVSDMLRELLDAQGAVDSARSTPVVSRPVVCDEPQPGRVNDRRVRVRSVLIAVAEDTVEHDFDLRHLGLLAACGPSCRKKTNTDHHQDRNAEDAQFCLVLLDKSVHVDNVKAGIRNHVDKAAIRREQRITHISRAIWKHFDLRQLSCGRRSLVGGRHAAIQGQSHTRLVLGRGVAASLRGARLLPNVNGVVLRRRHL